VAGSFDRHVRSGGLMDLGPFLVWLKFLHILGALGLVLTHGASAAVSFKLRGERDRVRIQALVELSAVYLNAFYISLAVVLIAGILTGIAGGYWTSGQFWIWASLVLFIATTVGMYLLATPWFVSVRHAVGVATYQDLRSGTPPPLPLGDTELAELLASRRPFAIAAVGLGAIVLLVFLMVFKPF
jgi:hypothetical protein